MRPADQARVQKEISNIQKDKGVSGVAVELKSDSSIKYMIGSLEGPTDTPYEGGLFYVDIELDDQYPFVPPKMKFITKALLSTPEPNNPQDAVVAKQYLSDKAAFDRTAKEWTVEYAHRDQVVSNVSKVQRLTDMGFDKRVVMDALSRCGGNEVKAWRCCWGMIDVKMLHEAYSFI
eukprot:jgi/Picre1/34696/NNA_002164.t1